MEPKFCVQASFGSQKKTLECSSFTDANALADSLSLADRRTEIVLSVPMRQGGSVFIPHTQFEAVYKAIEQTWRNDPSHAPFQVSEAAEKAEASKPIPPISPKRF